jgi:hypothetical protein
VVLAKAAKLIEAHLHPVRVRVLPHGWAIRSGERDQSWRVDIASAYEATWKFAPPRKCREMHAAGLFAPRAPTELRLALFEVYTPATIAEGDAFVSEQLVPGLLPIGGDRSGDRFCFDARLTIGGTTPVLYCPHDGGGARYVAPSVAAFVYRLVLENLSLAHLFEGWGEDRAALRALTVRNLALVDGWLLRRWARRANATLEAAWPTSEGLDAFMREDPAFARMPREEIEHFT